MQPNPAIVEQRTGNYRISDKFSSPLTHQEKELHIRSKKLQRLSDSPMIPHIQTGNNQIELREMILGNESSNSKSLRESR